MWIKALKVIPRISKEEWNGLDIISRWLIASRAAVFIMTALAGAIGGLLAYRNGNFSWHLFALSVLGIVMAHATNNLLNDYVDHSRGVDKDNYFRSQYHRNGCHCLMAVSCWSVISAFLHLAPEILWIR